MSISLASFHQPAFFRQPTTAMARELGVHSDRELADMGFSRADLPAIARGTYRR